jgi:Protein of unknown function (DUF3141)
MKPNLPQAQVASAPGIHELTRTPARRAAQRVAPSGSSWFGWANAQEYWLDACQRGLLSLDALRQRGNNYLEQKNLISPAVLNFAFEVRMDRRTFERPVNYVLVRITPPPGVTVDPRAGQRSTAESRLSHRKLKPLPPDPVRHQDSAIALSEGSKVRC